jgi:metal-responsive CopG/Arc/MetJ family transcriptional regulator
MKIAISVPDALYEDAERTAQAMGIPRSRLFARAAAEFIRRYEREQISEKLNEVYGRTENQIGSEKRSAAAIESLRELTRNDSW